MKKHTLRALGMAFVLTLCLPMVACDLSNMQFGGLVGELMADNAKDDTPGELENDLVIEDVFPDIQTAVDSYIEDYTYPVTEEPYVEPPMPDTTEAPSVDGTTEPPTTVEPLPDPVAVYGSFDDLYISVNGQREDIFTPGMHASWDAIAEVNDYRVESITAFGWAAFYAPEAGSFGYQIDDQEPVFDDTFAIDTEQAVIDSATGIGGKSASRFRIIMPIRDLSGNHTVKLLVKDIFGTVELFTEFKLTKAVDPNAPVFSFFPADMISSMPGSPDIADVQLGGTGEYISITTGDFGDPYYQLPMINGKGYVANYVTIKYRTTSEVTQGNLFIGSGSGPTGAGDMIVYNMINDGKWHVVLIDLSKVEAVVDGVINYLRWDMFREGRTNQIDLAYIAAFGSEQAALDYDASIADRYPD